MFNEKSQLPETDGINGHFPHTFPVEKTELETTNELHFFQVLQMLWSVGLPGRKKIPNMTTNQPDFWPRTKGKEAQKSREGIIVSTRLEYKTKGDCKTEAEGGMLFKVIWAFIDSITCQQAGI